MSPISASFSPMTRIMSAASGSPDLAEDEEPFMYRVPVFRTSGLDDRARPRPNTSRESVMPSRNKTQDPLSHVRRGGSPFDDDVVIAGDMGDTFYEGISAQSTTKITGFFPLKPEQPPTADLLPRLVGRLSPPPRRSSFTPSPWSFSGIERTEEDLSYSQVDPSTLEFQRHLLRRIDTKDRYTSSRCL